MSASPALGWPPGGGVLLPLGGGAPPGWLGEDWGRCWPGFDGELGWLGELLGWLGELLGEDGGVDGLGMLGGFGGVGGVWLLD